MIVNAAKMSDHRYRVHDARTHEPVKNVRYADSVKQYLEYYAEDQTLTATNQTPFYIMDTQTGERISG